MEGVQVFHHSYQAQRPDLWRLVAGQQCQVGSSAVLQAAPLQTEFNPRVAIEHWQCQLAAELVDLWVPLLLVILQMRQ